MTDRELLELAALAAGIKIDKSPYNGGGHGNTGFDVNGNAVLDWHNGKTWNPLADDGDALRLSLHLKISLDFRGCSKSGPSHIRATYLSTPGKDSSTRWVTAQYVPEEMFTPDHHKQEKFAAYLLEQGDHIRGLEPATRRAIVRAAAEIGKSMTGQSNHPAKVA